MRNTKYASLESLLSTSLAHGINTEDEFSDVLLKCYEPTRGTIFVGRVEITPEALAGDALDYIHKNYLAPWSEGPEAEVVR